MIRGLNILSAEARARVPKYKRAECLGSNCVNYLGEPCDSRLELLEASGKSGGIDLGPRNRDCNYAMYGQVCMGSDEQPVVSRSAESPNGQASTAELIARMGRTDGQRIVLNTPSEDVVFE